MKKYILAATMGLSLSTPGLAAEVDPALPGYEPVSGVSGNLKSIGSGTYGYHKKVALFDGDYDGPGLTRGHWMPCRI